MKTETLIYQTLLQRTGEITENEDDDLDAEIEFVLESLSKEDRLRVEGLLDRMSRLRWRNEVLVYKTGFEDCLRYVISVMGKVS